MMTELQTIEHCLKQSKVRVSAVMGVLDFDCSEANDPELALQEVAIVCRAALSEVIAFLQGAEGFVRDLSKSGGKA